MRKNNTIIILLLVLGLLSLTIGASIAFFNYTRTGSENTLATGRIYFLSTQSGTLNITNVFPIKASNVDPSTLDEVTVSIRGDTTYNSGEEYQISLTGLNNTINGKEIPLNYIATVSNVGTSSDTYWEDRGGNSSIYKLTATGSVEEDKQVLVGYIIKGSTGINGNIKIKAYVDGDRLAIADTYDGNETENMGTTNNWVDGRVVLTTDEWNSLQGNNSISFKIKAESNEGIWVEEPLLKAHETVNLALSNMTTPPIYVDNMGTNEDTTDDVTYLVGNNNAVDFNYVWYSGKMWRIMSINSDGTMKLITEDLITSMIPGSKDFSVSDVKQWLNEDFYSTLVNANNIVVQNSVWNYDNGTATSYDSTPLRPRTNNANYLVTAPVGLINAFEYYNIYNNSSPVDNYLQIGMDWLTLTETDTIRLRIVYRNPNEKIFSSSSSSQDGQGIRPVINLKNDVYFIGNGTKTNPYRIKGDINNPTYNTTLLNTRVSGEYVTFDNELYRIVGVDNNKTKIVRMDYVRDNGSASTPKAILNKSIGSTQYFGSVSNTQSNDYWDYYLNNTWYGNISNTYRAMIVDGTYYIGEINYGYSYKQTICKDDNLNSVTVNNCTRYVASDNNKTFTGKVGLLRYAEMFATQQKIDYDTTAYYLITPFSSEISKVFKYGSSGSSPININLVTVRPAIYLDASVKITSGTGLIENPFEITM